MTVYTFGIEKLEQSFANDIFKVAWHGKEMRFLFSYRYLVNVFYVRLLPLFFPSRNRLTVNGLVASKT